MQNFPLFMKLEDRKVLLVGGGEAALAKLRLLLRVGAVVKVVALKIDAEIEELLALHSGVCFWRAFESSDLEDVDLVFIAMEDEAEMRRVALAARRAHKFVNAVDRPAWCDFTMPAIVDRDGIVVAISTEGASPVLSQHVRGLIEDILHPRLGALAHFARRFRAAVAARLSNNRARRDFWSRLIEGSIGRKVLEGDEAGAARDLMRSLNGPLAQPERQAMVRLIGVPDKDLELLTLKSVRWLREANFILYDSSIDGKVLDYARRDAKRIGLSVDESELAFSSDVQMAIEAAKAGQRIVCLCGNIAGEWSRVTEFLEKSGISYEVAPAGAPIAIEDRSEKRLFG